MEVQSALLRPFTEEFQMSSLDEIYSAKKYFEMEEHINSFFDLIQVDITEPEIKQDKYYMKIRNKIGQIAHSAQLKRQTFTEICNIFFLMFKKLFFHFVNNKLIFYRNSLKNAIKFAGKTFKEKKNMFALRFINN